MPGNGHDGAALGGDEQVFCTHLAGGYMGEYICRNLSR